jgi:hypothetical protein
MVSSGLQSRVSISGSGKGLSLLQNGYGVRPVGTLGLYCRRKSDRNLTLNDSLLSSFRSRMSEVLRLRTFCTFMAWCLDTGAILPFTF